MSYFLSICIWHVIPFSSKQLYSISLCAFASSVFAVQEARKGNHSRDSPGRNVHPCRPYNAIPRMVSAVETRQQRQPPLKFILALCVCLHPALLRTPAITPAIWVCQPTMRIYILWARLRYALIRPVDQPTTALKIERVEPR